MDIWLGLAGLFLIWGLGLVFVLYPAKVVRWHASVNRRLYEWAYKKLDKNLIDRTQMPWETYLLGSKTDYALRGSENPQLFPRAIWFIRLLGVIPLVVTTVVLLCIALAR